MIVFVKILRKTRWMVFDQTFAERGSNIVEFPEWWGYVGWSSLGVAVSPISGILGPLLLSTL